MRQTLLRIPLEGPWSFGSFEVAGFGFGVVLLVWMVVGVLWLARHRLEFRSPRLVSAAGLWLVVAAAIVLLPQLIQWSQWQANAEISAANRVLAIDPRSEGALLQRAQARFSKQLYQLAVDDLTSAAQIDPENSIVLNRSAWIQATCPDATVRNPEEALKNSTKACQIAGNKNPEFLASLAASRAALGDFEQAVEIQRRALALVPRPSDGRFVAELQPMREELQSYERGRPYRDFSVAHSFPHSVPIYGFGAMLFCGFIAGAWTAGRRGARVGYTPEMLWDVGIWLFIAGVIGCRVFYCIQYGSQLFFTDQGNHRVLKSLPQLVIAAVDLPDGGLVYYGGIPAGLLATAWVCRQRKLNLLEFGDVIIPSLFLGMAFGRIGCFLNGCCYGQPCELPWGVHFPMGSVPDINLVVRGFLSPDQDLNFRLHPTQLYSSIDALILFLLTQAYFAYRPTNGAVIALAALTYPLTRFAIESLRGDELGQFNTSLTISQWISILTFGFGVLFTIWLSRRPKAKWLPA